MMRSLYAGVSAVRAHQVRMDVIGNNIANVNTVSYKASRTTFRDVLYQTMKGAQAPVEGKRGGVNPMQVGLGVGINSIDTLQTQGNLERTDIPTDMAIEGAGFFILSDGVQTYYTREGAFKLDAQSHLVNASTGYKVRGWMAENGVVNTTKPPGDDISIPIAGDRMTAKATGSVELRGNLDAGEGVGYQYSVPVEVFDSLGKAHTLILTLKKTNSNEWSLEVAKTDPDIWNIAITDPSSSSIVFDSDGSIEPPDSATLQIDYTSGVATPQTVTLDLSYLTQYASESTVAMTFQDGFPPGVLEDFSVDDTGRITGIYSNGQHEVIGQIALASFANPAGLLRLGSNLYLASQNSGSPVVGRGAEGGRGKVVSGSLEMSNVDLAREFTDMIVTQRGFQANSRVITASDEMLQELLTLKR